MQIILLKTNYIARRAHLSELVLLQLGVFSFGFFQDGNIAVGIFPQREEVVVGGAGLGEGGVGLGALGGRSFKRVRAAGAMRAAYSS